MNVTPKLDEHMRAAIANSVRRAKGELLGFIDYQAGLVARQSTKTDQAFFEALKKQVHSVVSVVEYQVTAAWEIAKADGVIPRFGRSEDERAATLQRNHHRSG